MRFIPFEKITYKTSLTATEVARRIKDQIVEERLILFGLMASVEDNYHTKMYEGTINGGHFKIRRTINNTDKFHLLIGSIQSDPDGAVIKVKIRMQALVYIFCLTWLSFVSVFIYMLLPFTNNTLIPIAMLVGGYVAIIVDYNNDRKKVMKEFKIFFEARIVK